MIDLSDVIVPDTQTLDRMLSKTKGRLFTKKGAGYLGSLLCDHEFVWDPSAETAWCNGTTIGWGPAFYTWLTMEERITVLAHELWHTGFDHMDRMTKVHDPEKWNIAADYVINNMLYNAGFVFGDKLMSLKPYLDLQYDGMTTEQVYNLLPDDPQPPRPMDRDVRPADEASKQRVTSSIIKAIQSSRMAKEIGVIPGEVELIIDQFLNPILPWEILLQQYFTEFSNDDYSWKRPSRRYDDEYLPSLLSDSGLEHLIYYIDVSGSVSDADVLRVNSEVKCIHENLAPKRLTVVTFDEQIQDSYEFTDDMPFDKIVIHGRGGTDLDPVRQHIIKHRPTAAVIFSDLYVHPMEMDPGVPVLWIVVGNKSAQTFFGRRIHIENEPVEPIPPGTPVVCVAG
jgi:predicted metal-dependent peptidase